MNERRKKLLWKRKTHTKLKFMIFPESKKRKINTEIENAINARFAPFNSAFAFHFDTKYIKSKIVSQYKFDISHSFFSSK